MSRPSALALVHGLNRVVRPLDRAVFAPRPPAALRDPVFIVGPARSGTTLLYQALAHVAQTTWLPQLLDYGYGATHLAFRVAGRRLERHRADFRSRYGRSHGWLAPSEAFGFWRQWFWKGHDGDHRHAAALPDAGAADLRAAAREVSAHRGTPMLVKCLYLSLSVPALAAAFPDARFVYIRRDAVATAASSLRARAATAPGTWWSTRPEGFSDHLDEPPVDQVLWQLASIARTIAADLSRLPAHRWIDVRYEDFCARPAAVATAICDRFGLARWPDPALPAAFAPGRPEPHSDAALAASRYFADALDALR
jgi:hypothetical protein